MSDAVGPRAHEWAEGDYAVSVKIRWPALGGRSVNRLAIVAWSDPSESREPDLLRHLDQLRPCAEEFVVVASAPLSPELEAQVLERGGVLVRVAYGGHFGAWRDALERCDWAAAYGTVILSRGGQLGRRELAEMSRPSSSIPVEIMGLASDRDADPASEVELLMFSSPAVRSQAFLRFWADMKFPVQQLPSSRDREHDLYLVMTSAGFRCAAWNTPVAREMRLAHHIDRPGDPLTAPPLRAADQQPHSGDVALLLASGVVDPVYYSAQCGDPVRSVESTVEHYLREGDRLGYSVSPLLDTALMQASTQSADRPVVVEWLRARNWSAITSRAWRAESYLTVEPDAANHPGGPVGHLMQKVAIEPSHRVAFATADGRAFPWRNAYDGMLRAAREHRSSVNTLKAKSGYSGREGIDESMPLDDPIVPEPLATIVMVARDCGASLRAAVESIQAQTWSNWELIIVDRGSTDDTRLIEELLSTRDPRIHLERAPGSSKAEARNTGLRRGGGQWVAFLDPGAVWNPSYLRSMITTLTPLGAQVGYCSTSVDRAGRPSFHGGAAPDARLIAGNWIQLDAVLVTRELAASVDGFDADLSAQEDYDFLLKLEKLSPLTHVPILGLSLRPERDDPASAYRSAGWEAVVRLKHSLTDPIPGASPGISVVCIVQGGSSLQAFATRIRSARRFAAEDTQVILAAVDVSLDERNALLLAAASMRNVQVRHFGAHDSYAFVVNAAARSARYEDLVVLDPRAEFDETVVRRLAGIVRSSPSSAAGPVTLSGRSVVDSIGAMLAGSRQIPVPLLAMHPVDDIKALPDRVEVPLLSGRTFAIRAETFRAIGGLDPLLVNQFDLEALCIALKSRSENARAVVSTVDLLRLSEPESCFLPMDYAQSTDEFLRRRVPSWTHGDAGLHSLLGLAVVGWQSLPVTASEPDEPILVRRRTSVVVEGAEVPRLRWAIKTASPGGRAGERWGDTHFARSLAEALRSFGQLVVVDPRDAHRRPHEHLDDVVLTLRGLVEYVPLRGPLNYMWLISHPDLVTRSEAVRYRRVFAASVSWSHKRQEEWQLPIEPLLQCTDPAVFHPIEDGVRGGDVVFVGNSRNVPRPVVVEPVTHGLPVQVYGGEWEAFVPNDVIRATYVPNDEVKKLYATASIVLNDHWADMARNGFISNRLFDVVASGGRVLSDKVEGIDELFGGAVHTYDSVASIVPALRGEHDRLFAEPTELIQVARRIRDEHSFRARARLLIDRALEDLAENGNETAPTAACGSD